MADKKIWDLDRLMACADAFDVADRIGMKKRKSGSSTYVECVDGTHHESNINHNQLFHDGCHCYSCGANHNTYGMVRGYYSNVLGISLEHDEICSIIAETCGGEESFLLKPIAGVKKKPFPLTKKELELIGLCPSSQRAKFVVSYSNSKDEEHREMIDYDGYAKTELLPSVSIYSLYKDDEDLFRWLVGNKVSETIEQTRNLYSTFKSSQDELSKAFVRLAIERYNAAVCIGKRLFPNKFKKAVS